MHNIEAGGYSVEGGTVRKLIKNPFIKLLVAVLCMLFLLILAGKAALFFSLDKDYKGYNVLFVSVLGLRADHLGYNGYKVIDTSAIDALAQGSPVFKNAYSVSTRPEAAYLSMFTGKYPSGKNLIRGRHNFVGEKYFPLSQYLNESGYSTIAVTSNASAFKKMGLMKGFEVIEDVEVNAESVQATTKEAKGLLDSLENGQRPFFMWVNYSVPLYPYFVPEGFDLSPEEHPYDRQMLMVDRAVSELMEQLQKNGNDRETIVIFTSVCGEGLNEHGEFSHGFLLYNSTLKVPIIIKIPGFKQAGRYIGTEISHLDITPTLLDILKTPVADPKFDGKSLFDNMCRGDKVDERDIFIENPYGYYEFGWKPIAGVISGKFKYLDSRGGEIYNMEADPYELKNLISEESDLAKSMENRLALYLAENSPDIFEVRGEGAEPVDNIPFMRPPPISLIGTPEKAVMFYESILSKDPNNKKVKFILGKIYFGMGRLPMAKIYLEDLVEADPGYYEAMHLLGDIYNAFGNKKKAEENYEKVVRIDPNNAVCLNNLAWSYSTRGAFLEKSLEYAKRANDIVPRNSHFLDTLSEVYLRMEDFEQAMDCIRKAALADMSPRNLEYTRRRLEYIKNKVSETKE